jgi:hypothetical protein
LIHFSFRCVLLPLGVALVVALLVDSRVLAQPGQDGDGQPNGGPPVYQQHALDGHRRDERRDRRDFRRGMRYMPPQVSAGWFQRPYPYHLDYYKMRYGGSYAPYYGNLYGTPFGTPQVVNYPPYYGPYYNGYGNGYANGYGQPGYGEAPMEYPANSGVMMPGAANEESLPSQTQAGESQKKKSNEVLPAPTP